MSFTLCLDSWEDLKALAKKFNLLCLMKETAEDKIQQLIGAKYKADHISETPIEFDIVKAMGGKEPMEEFFGEAKHGPEFYKKMLELYETNGVRVWYAKAKTK